MIHISLIGEPKSTQTIYRYACRGKFPGMYMSSIGKDIKESYYFQLKNQYKGEVITKSLQVELKLYFGTKRRSDIDNFNKLVLDACTGILWEDDSQIEQMTISKHYDKSNPRIELTIK